MQSMQCPQHGVVEQAWPCPRCGTFLCEGCAHRTRPDAAAMCGGCWALRATHVETLKPRTLNLSSGIVICGVLSVIPFMLPVQVGTLIASGVLLYRREIPAREPLLALGLALLGLIVTAVSIFLLPTV